MKDRTRWFLRQVHHPMRTGFYECSVHISSAMPPLRWVLEWDGNGFLVPIPMVVLKWRGLTKKAFTEATREES